MSRWDAQIQEAGQRYNVDPRLVASVIQVESGGDPNAVSSAGALGLGQHLPTTAAALGIDPKDPAQSIDGVAKLLDENLRRYGNVEQAILAYHGGTDQANWGPKTQNYLQKITRQYGAPDMPKTAAAQSDDFSAFADRFGFTPGQPQAKAEKPADDFSAFQQRFGFAPGAQAEAQAPAEQQVQAEQPAQGGSIAQVSAPAEAQPGIVSQGAGLALQGLQKLGETGINVARGLNQGISESLDAPSEWLAAGAEKSGLTGLLGSLGVQMPTAAQQEAINVAGRKRFEQDHPDGWSALGKIGGSMAGVTVPVMAGEAALVKGSQMAKQAAGLAPDAGAAIGSFLRGQGGLASKSAYSALQGAAGGALLSGGQPDVSTLDAAGLGALLGGAIPSALLPFQYGARATKALTAPFTESGRQGLAANSIRTEALKDAANMGVAPEVAAADAARAAQPATNAAARVKVRGGAIRPQTAPEAMGASPVTAAEQDAAEQILQTGGKGGRIEANYQELVPGSVPTLAQATGNAGVAALERAAMSRSPNQFAERQLANYQARNAYLDQIKGTPETLESAIAKREEQAIPLLQKALDGAGIADSGPVMATINGILKGPAGQRDVVKTALNQVASKLKINPVTEVNPLIPGSSRRIDPNGNGLQYDVNQLYGVRKSINDQLEKVAGRDNSASQLASSELLQVKKALDESIEKAAPGFKDYLKTYAELSKPITSQSYLQNLNLTDATSNRITLPAVKSALQKIDKMRKAPGANEAKDISDDQLAMLRNLHADLQREANSARGMALGSNTFQNLMQNQLIESLMPGRLSALAPITPGALGGAAGWAAGGAPGAAIGSMLGGGAGRMFSNAAQNQAPDVEAKLINYLLNPQGGEVLRDTSSGAGKALEQLIRSTTSTSATGATAASSKKD